jgi:AbrB family looped-hinge helix DNA binding protein
MTKIFKVLGKRGRITIPYEIRQSVGFRYNDILSFAEQDDNTVIIKREKVCDNCQNIAREEKPVPIVELLDDLSDEEQKEALIHLSVKWAQKQGGGNN